MSGPILFAAGKNPLQEQGGGHSSYVRAHARAAIAAGFQPHIFCLGEREESIECDFGIVEVARSPAPRMLSPPGKSFRTLSAAWNVPALADRLEQFALSSKTPVIFHGFWVWSAAAVEAGHRVAVRQIPSACLTSVFTSLRHEGMAKLRGSLIDRDLPGILQGTLEWLWVAAVRRSERAALRGSHLVLYNYESVRAIFEREDETIVPFRKIPYAPETAFLRESIPSRAYSDDQPVRFIAVSRHDPRKGLGVLLRALARLRSSGTRFQARLIGGGSLLEHHRRLVASLRLDDVVQVAGYVDDAFALLESSDAFVLPSLEEGGGSVSLLEALQAGLPVVASDVDGIPEDVADGESALLVPPGDEGALADALTKIAENRELRIRLGQRGRQVFEERFSARALTRALGDIYREVREQAGKQKVPSEIRRGGSRISSQPG